jgi:hypothetical protein
MAKVTQLDDNSTVLTGTDEVTMTREGTFCSEVTCSTRQSTFQTEIESDRTEDPDEQPLLPARRVKNVPLHKLCSTCSQFTKNCYLLNLLQNPNKSAFEDLTIKNSSDHILCTISDLLDGYLQCHMCTLIYKAWTIGNDGNLTANLDPRERVSLHMQPVGSSKQIFVSVGNETATRHQNKHVFSPLRICSTELDYDDGDPPLLGWTAVPEKTSENVEMIRKWLETCQEGHTKCNLFGRQTMASVPTKSSKDIGGLSDRPTRVLDVAHSRVRLKHNTSQDARLEYLTLSHMWGTDATQQLKLESDTLEPFQHDVPWEELPKIFQEAIRITRRLGYRYIWIDSLCIIQDSDSDWAKEAARMATVYGNSSCNLAFVYPPQESFPKEREDPRLYAPCVLRPKARSVNGVYLSLAVSASTVDWLEPKRWPLFNRAWVFQERILSSRNLYYGNEAMVWECCELFCDELVGTTSTALDTYTHGTEILSKYYLHSTIMKILALPTKVIVKGPRTEEIRKFIEVWTSAVSEYRCMRLTKFEDRVVAFAGIAQAIQNLSGFVYLAGLWRDFLPLGLLWGFKQSGAVREPGIKDAPSWSWFSVPITEEGTMIDFSLLFRWTAAPRWEAYSATLLSASRGEEVLPKRQSVLIDFVDLALSIEARVLSAELRWMSSTSGQLATLHIPELNDINDTFQLTYYHDGAIDLQKRKEKSKEVIVAVFAHFIIGEDPDGSSVHHLAGLALIPESEGTWRRIGLWKIEDKDSTVDTRRVGSGPDPKRLGHWETREIMLV